jgi:hypothetical protein
LSVLLGDYLQTENVVLLQTIKDVIWKLEKAIQKGRVQSVKRVEVNHYLDNGLLDEVRLDQGVVNLSFFEKAAVSFADFFELLVDFNEPYQSTLSD